MHYLKHYIYIFTFLYAGCTTNYVSTPPRSSSLLRRNLHYLLVSAVGVECEAGCGGLSSVGFRFVLKMR